MISEEWQVRGVEADSGVYVICGMAGDWHHVVQAESGTAASDTIRLLTRPGEFRRLDFEVVESRALMAGFRRDPREADLDAVVDRLLGLGGGRDSVEEDRGVATLIGTVKAAEDGRPVAGAHVRVLERDEERITGAEGAFVIRDLPRGRYRLVTEHLGMASDTAGVDLRSGAGQMVLFTLETQPIALPTLDVQIERTFRSPRIAEFYERMQRGVGDFIGREDLDARDLVFNMRRLPNVRVDECIDPNSGLRLSGCWHINIARGVSGGALRGDAHCPPVMYVDGRPLPASAGDTRSNAFTLLQNLPRDMLEGIEVYRSPGGAPAQYRTIGDACGIILVWTRGR